MSYPLEGRHINVQELHAVMQTMRWRCRKLSNIRTRICHAHAVNSQVTMAVLSKGRNSSRQLNRLLLKSNAIVLAASLQLLIVYVKTDWNPADRPSRWLVRKDQSNERGEGEQSG